MSLYLSKGIANYSLDLPLIGLFFGLDSKLNNLLSIFFFCPKEGEKKKYQGWYL